MYYESVDQVRKWVDSKLLKRVLFNVNKTCNQDISAAEKQNKTNEKLRFQLNPLGTRYATRILMSS